jgi:hypothetical protein
MRAVVAILLLLASTGCQLIPEIAHQPVVHNPFPQLTKIAIAPFFNLSAEASVDGRQFAQAYFNELQLIRGFEVVPVGVVERAMHTYQLDLDNPDEVRKLATVLGVDAVVIGAVTDFTPYYPPRCAMQVEWYAANPCFQPIPAGYGLPWGTPEEEGIPGPLVLESEFALARAQLRTQTPHYPVTVVPVPPPVEVPMLDAPQVEPGRQTPFGPLPGGPMPGGSPSGGGMPGAPSGGPNSPQPTAAGQLISHQVAAGEVFATDQSTAPTTAAIGTVGTSLPPDYPDARNFIPPPPGPGPCDCLPSNEPVLRHTRTYNGNDGQLTEALASYAFFMDEGRGVGWQSYLQRSDDFIRFCCHMHIYETLTARGGGGETRVVWRWSNDRYEYR